METALEIFANHRAMLDRELKEFVDSYKGPGKKEIELLADKIKHMCEYIGSPSSVMPMLSAILRGTKRLYFHASFRPGSSSSGHRENGIGHFKWDDRVQTLTPEALSHIRAFYFSGELMEMAFNSDNEYNVQAFDFLRKHNSTMHCKLLRKGRYFNEDTEGRHVYEITLKRNGEQYVFTFGQSVYATQRNETPSVYDVLSTIQKYDPGTFENFCGDFGYDEDSRKAEKTYQAVQDEYNNIKRLFSSAELEEMQEIN